MSKVPNLPVPKNEAVRIQTLHNYSILDTLPEREYDDITMLASQICGTPISLISLIDKDRQWFKSKVGLITEETSRKDSFCAHAIIHPEEIFTVKDSRNDKRFSDNPLVTGDPNVIFYTGVPLVSTEGMALGTLCVIDNHPKELTLSQLTSLKALSNQVVSLLELRKSKILLEKSTDELKKRNSELEKFAHVAAHDIKSPLNNIVGLSEVLISEHSLALDDDARTMLILLNTSSKILRNLVDGILSHSKTDALLSKSVETIRIFDLIDEITTLLNAGKNVIFRKDFPDVRINVNRIALQQILLNLVANAIKYNDKETPEITFRFSDNAVNYSFSVEDNGSGIEQKNLGKIFEIFETASYKDRFGDSGTGIGLSTVKKLVEGMGGTIHVESTFGQGTVFTFIITKNNFI